jgi:hypothetical protein
VAALAKATSLPSALITAKSEGEFAVVETDAPEWLIRVDVPVLRSRREHVVAQVQIDLPWHEMSSRAHENDITAVLRSAR